MMTIRAPTISAGKIVTTRAFTWNIGSGVKRTSEGRCPIANA
jgi:hypothetical protein